METERKTTSETISRSTNTLACGPWGSILGFLRLRLVGNLVRGLSTHGFEQGGRGALSTNSPRASEDNLCSVPTVPAPRYVAHRLEVS